ncbi:MAG: hypothetical protein JNL32_03050 [Candidatus Kapabacteria bacterium]|nr:hypothetical protein [Candidatus Kapabacteria bacterium]
MRVIRFNSQTQLTEERASNREHYESSAFPDGDGYNEINNEAAALVAISSLYEDMLLRQNIARLHYRTFDTVVLPVLQPLFIPFNTVTIRGDFIMGSVFRCQSPGYYNIKAAADIHARVYESGPASVLSLDLIVNGIPQTPAIDKSYLPALTYLLGVANIRTFLSGADKVLLREGDEVRLGISHDGTTALNTQFLESRLALQRTGDIINNLPDCSCIA